MSVAYLHRGAKRQPVGMEARSGTLPGMLGSTFTPDPSLGTEAIRP